MGDILKCLRILSGTSKILKLIRAAAFAAAVAALFRIAKLVIKTVKG